LENVRAIGLDRLAIAPDEDAVLASRAQTEPAAFGLLYERHVLAVYRYLRARGADEDMAEEMTAVAFERALRRIDRYRPSDAGFRPWLLAIARNAWIDGHRRSAHDTVLDEAACRLLPENRTDEPCRTPV
jgi:RNA polymerase sigma factor (sigma-70 family)